VTGAPFQVPRPGRGPLFLATSGLAAIVGAASLGALGLWRVAGPPTAEPAPVVQAVPSFQPAEVPEPPPLRMSVVTVRLAARQTLAQALAALGLDGALAQQVVAALGNIFPFHKARPGDQLRLERVLGEPGLRRLTYRRDASEEWTVQPCENGTLYGEKRVVELTTTAERVALQIAGSVWDSLKRAGEEPALAVAAADVLAWDVDFYQDVRTGDALKVLVEKVFAEGKFLRYGEILAAEYEGAVTGRKRLFRYSDPAGQAGYYDDEGHSARRGFLRSPLRYAAHMTSRFGRRMHPLLGYVRAHAGIDYGAPSGTPVWAVGDGVVEKAGFGAGFGKIVEIRHRNGLVTQYAHLSSIAVRTGAHVSQRQTIGAVGSTGLSTGPHLHFAVRRDGSYVNPLSLRLPRELPIAPELRADFEAKSSQLRLKLEAGTVASM
jgi:murein DD-endopeptidase MepM/ murein hydrolase activator NlpD